MGVLQTILKWITKSVAAGFMICIAAIVYLRSSNPVIGAALFAFGLLTILIWHMGLFTGIIGYFAEQRTWSGILKHAGLCLLVWVGNFLGCAFLAHIYKDTSQWASIQQKADALVSMKCQSSVVSLIYLGVLCGVLMFLAVHTWKQYKLSPVSRVCMVFLPVMVFILSGFEHSIADMAYVMLSTTTNFFYPLVMLTFVSIGNIIGGVAACGVINFISKENTKC